jgi:S1-C subfamily serine protease
VKVAGHEVRDADALREHVGQAEAGASLDVTVLRDGRSVDVSVKLGGQGPSS